MSNKDQHSDFEKTLREILDSRDPAQPAAAPVERPAEASRQEGTAEPVRAARRLPKWAEWVIRMLAAFIAALLLAAFGMHVALH